MELLERVSLKPLSVAFTFGRKDLRQARCASTCRIIKPSIASGLNIDFNYLSNAGFIYSEVATDANRLRRLSPDNESPNPSMTDENEKSNA